jgi:hypothetical protein
MSEAVRDNDISVQFVLTCLLGYDAVGLNFPLGCTVYSFCVGVYVVSIPGYSVQQEG